MRVVTATSAGSERPGSADQLRRIVLDHRARGGREEASKRRFLDELGRLERPCDESADPVHVTASAVVVGPRGTVLHLHRRLGRWMQPGGHIDAGENPGEAALREAEEETGLSLSHPAGGPVLLHLDVHPAARGHTHLDLRYLLLAADDEPAPPPGESPHVRWCSWEEAGEMADESLRGALVAARRVVAVR